MSAPNTVLPTDSAARKNIPLVRGLLDYFPAALAAVAEVSQAGNEKHNPGEPLHWARGKSGDHADCIVRHIVDRGTIDHEDGLRHSAKVAWRALALLQEELEAAGAAMPRGAWSATKPSKAPCKTGRHAFLGYETEGAHSRCSCGMLFPANDDSPAGLSAHLKKCQGSCE